MGLPCVYGQLGHYHGTGGWLECGHMGKQLDTNPSSQRMRSGAVITVGNEKNYHFNTQIRTTKPLRVKFRLQRWLNTFQWNKMTILQILALRNLRFRTFVIDLKGGRFSPRRENMIKTSLGLARKAISLCLFSWS